MKSQQATHRSEQGNDGRQHLLITFGRSAFKQVRLTEIDCVIDTDVNGNVLGVEVLDLSEKLGGKPSDFEPLADGSVRVTYQTDEDALYLRLLDGRSTDQQPIMAKVQAGPEVITIELVVPDQRGGAGSR